jgi:hypothetical protein
MLDQEYIAEQLMHWVVDFVEKPNALLNGWPPCPYARQARISNKFSIKFAATDQLFEVVDSSVADLQNQDVIAICFDHTEISADLLESRVHEYNQTAMLQNIVILEDHPAAEELLNGVKMNFGLCGIIFIQQLSKLNDASDQLRSKGYYDHWPEENLDAVVNWRLNTHNDLQQNQS